MVTAAPASSSALTGSVNSDSSKPSVARTATRKPVNSDMITLLENGRVRFSHTICEILPVRGLRQIDYNGFAAIPHDDPLRRLIGRRIDLLMRHVGRDEQE